ncbi:3'-5' exonuclease [Vibrio sp. SCSIO 43136]|uniref:3'-5' exonuclease n=1 Tax=Vibrio sp. SCSIO 43136 TaxID=2819101 RepID=UPI002075D3BA|nr:3'-5' exonuclease [Vibrio sp. SCSIO 43136]USD66426.1 3'-5' exonuclease [Vibrio sp. SCSIO 43136]
MLKRLTQKPSPNWVEILESRLVSAQDQRLKDFYQAGTPAKNTPVSNVEFVALDFETTGLDAEKDDIVSVGLVPFTLKRIYCRQAKHWIVQPNSPLEEESVVIHGITHSDILNAPDLDRIIGELLKALAGKIVVVHYQYIERNFLDQALQARWGEGITFPMVDTMDLENRHQQRKNGGLLNRLKGKKQESIRLGSSRERYGLPAYPPHHALTDAMATAELLIAQIQYHYDPETPIGDIWV